MNKVVRSVFFLSITLYILHLGAAVTINESGVYSLRQNETTAITISANDVVLDLGGYFFSNSGSTVITVSSGYSNISIQNGTITGAATGILVNNSCSNISIKNIKIDGMTSRGINFTGTLGNEIASCLIEGCSVINGASTTTFYGLSFSYCKAIKVVNCAVQNCSAAGASNHFRGMDINDSSCFWVIDFIVKSCTAVDNVYGIYLEDVENSLFERCNIIDNSSSGAVFVGFYTPFSSSVANILKDSIVSGNSASDILCGLFTYEPNHIFENVIVQNNTSATNCIGFYALGEKTRLINCVANHNLTTASGNAQGIFINANYCSCVRCVAGYNISATGGSGNSSGIVVEGSGDYSVIYDCVAHGHATGGSGTHYGFYSNDPNDIFTKCLAYNNSSDFSGVNDTATIGTAASRFENVTP